MAGTSSDSCTQGFPQDHLSQRVWEHPRQPGEIVSQISQKGLEGQLSGRTCACVVTATVVTKGGYWVKVFTKPEQVGKD